ncbi:MAG: hypothetical protein NDI77_03615 [Geobacteraceae bacterium]|nr:hypothetical protein [Geobacteraceae bacterium]
MKKVLLTLAAMALMAAPAMAASQVGNPGYFTGTEAGPNSKQYHSYDGLICTDCHTLHGSENGQAVTAGRDQTWAGSAPSVAGGGYRELLKKGDWTDMCLSCHKQGYNTSSTVDLPNVTDSGWEAPVVMTLGGTVPSGKAMPGGDFYFSNIDAKKGHNPAYTPGSFGGAATSKLMLADSTLTYNPPGGSINDGEWSCHSCHGMHARFSGGYTAYRQIKRKVNGIVQTADVRGFGTEIEQGDYTLGQQAAAYEPIKSNSRGSLSGFDYLASRGDGLGLDGASLNATYGDANKNIYRGGFSSFCATCHGNFHGGNVEAEQASGNSSTNTYSAAGTWVKHPTNIAMGQTASSRKYGINTYKAVVTSSVGTTNQNGDGYDWKYPLVKPDTDGTVKNNVASKGVAGTLNVDDRIMCLTCHKAHATDYANMVRWDAKAHSFIQNGSTDFEGELSSGDNLAYGCGKCHQKGGKKAYVKAF